MLTHYYEQLAQTQARGDTITVTTLQDLFYQVIILHSLVTLLSYVFITIAADSSS